MSEDFFEERSEQSAIKTQIVEQYFDAWAGVMKSSATRYGHADKRLAYFDLFCGPGRYKDGSVSVPIRIIEKAVKDEYLAQNLVTVFNDKDEDAVSYLRDELNRTSGIESLKYRPDILCGEVDDQFRQKIEKKNLIPSLSFLDPWGYKALSLGLIEAFIKDWGCDCFFFFNYNRISMGMENPAISQHIDSLFSKGIADRVRLQIAENNYTPSQRNSLILDAIIYALEQKAGNQKRFVLPFCFKTDNGNRISHYLIFVTKHFRGYDIMKDIMHRASSEVNQGVASFAYCPADKIAPRLFEMSQPRDALEERLISNYSGRRFKLEELYEEDSYRTPYVMKNYQEAVLELEAKGRVTIERPSSRSPKNRVARQSILEFNK